MISGSESDLADELKPWLDTLQTPDGFEELPPTTTFPGVVPDNWDSIPLEDRPSSERGRFPGAAREDIDAATKAYEWAGIDILAFYKSFRFKHLPPFQGRWGVFLLEPGVDALCEELWARNQDTARSRTEFQQLAEKLLITHEQYHFWIDVWALSHELLPFDPRVKRYEPYLLAKRSVELTVGDVEESLANYYAVGAIRRRFPEAKGIVTDVLKQGPIPYCDFDFTREEAQRVEGMLAGAVRNGVKPHDVAPINLAAKMNLSTSTPALRLQALAPTLNPHGFFQTRHYYNGNSGLTLDACRIWRVPATGYSSVIAPFQGPSRYEFLAFVRSYLSGVLLPNKGDHAHYRIDNEENLKFPNPHHKNILGFEFESMVHQAGIQQKEYREERQRTRVWRNGCPRQVPKPAIR